MASAITRVLDPMATKSASPSSRTRTFWRGTPQIEAVVVGSATG
ncbi:hypothetical protein BH23ACT5_BH23ACT5_21350 [soil metagenome]